MEVVDVKTENKELIRRYRALLTAAKHSKSRKDRKLIRKAFDIAVEAHKDMRRKSGEPYIFHPISVALIVAEEIGLDTTSIICALLHDTVEDTEISLEDVEKMFGSQVMHIIDGLTKISGVLDNTQSMQAENFRKILLTLSDDVRVILIKLSDRLDNMRTLEAVDRRKQLKIASETSFLYAPLAHRLGLYSIKSELEDLALKYTEPESYAEVASKLEKTKEVRDRYISSFSRPIKVALNRQNFKYDIKGRTKSISSILEKMHKKDIPFEEVYDVFAIRIIVKSKPEKEKADCWRIYSTVTDFYQPKPDRLRDWISTPRANGYESLHTTVMSPTGRWIEVQIRTQRMDEVAEKGLAAHWKYKEGNEAKNLDSWLNNIRELIENPESDAIDFLDDFKMNLFSDEIFVFTPKGDVKSLPVGATALDFAFDIHTDIGYSCIGAKVNNKLVPLSEKLRSGDQIEIISSKKQKPNEDWLKFVVTAKAKSKIKSSLNEEKKVIANDGKEIFDRKLKHLKIPNTVGNKSQIQKFYDLNSLQDLYYQVATEQINLLDLRKLELNKGKLQSKVKAPKAISEAEPEGIQLKNRKDDTLVIGEDMDKFDYKLSPCCNPIPGDEVFGFITINDGIKIHKTNCPNAAQLLSNYAYRVVKARWTGQKKIAFLAGIKVTGIDEVGIVNKITRIISNELNVNMRSISFDSNDGIFEGKIMVFVHDTKHLTSLIEKLKAEKGVINISRIDSN